jgi:cell pole-organizing protein PopZ
MDDVLASIRRIVRNDKDAGPGEPVDPRLLPEETDNGTLLLTPEMRTDAGSEAAGTALAHDAADASDTPVQPRAPVSDALSAMVRAILLEELRDGPARDAVREIIQDELIHGETGGNVSANVVRLVRDEVRRAMSER